MSFAAVQSLPDHPSGVFPNPAPILSGCTMLSDAWNGMNRHTVRALRTPSYSGLQGHSEIAEQRLLGGRASSSVKE